MTQERSFHVFLSYAHEDVGWVEQLAARLADAGLSVWFDGWVLVPGTSWQAGMARGLKQSRSVVVCIGAQTTTGWVEQEIEAALNRGAGEPDYRVIPVLIPGARQEAVGTFLGLRTWVDLRKGMGDARAVQKLVDGVLGRAPGRGADDRGPTEAGATARQDAWPPNPFTPLSGRIADPARVHNRDRELDRALSYLRAESSVALIGRSGIGKSSLLTLLMACVHERLGPAWEALYLDMQLFSDEAQFREALCEGLRIPNCRGHALKRALEDRRVLLCLDEVEKLSWDDEGFTRGQRAELRGLAEGPDAPLKLALAARLTLDRLFRDSQGATSPLANICLQVDVGPWDEGTARAFLLARLAEAGAHFAEAEIVHLATASGGRPMQLTRAAYHLYNERQGGGQ